MGIIQRLPQELVNLIAADEVISKSANADKELIESSMDAKATEIDIIISDAGLNLLNVQDNGCMIGNDDLKIVAERFVTFKTKSMDDFKKMQTYV